MTHPSPSSPATMRGRIAFQLSTAVWSLLGLDDHAYVAQTYPSLLQRGRDKYEASQEDALAILDDLKDRAGPDFDYTATERRALSAAARRLTVARCEHGVLLAIMCNECAGGSR